MHCIVVHCIKSSVPVQPARFGPLNNVDDVINDDTMHLTVVLNGAGCKNLRPLGVLKV